MHALEIQCNGKTLAIAGASNALMITANVHISVEDETPHINIGGMFDLGNERKSHVGWLDSAPLQLGDRLNFRFVETDRVTAPFREVATDSAEHLAEQADYDEFLKSNPPAPRQLAIKRPDAAFQLDSPDGEKITATLEGGRESISMNVMWDQWSPERCRVSLSSFSQQEALARTGAKEWFLGALQVGDQCALLIG